METHAAQNKVMNHPSQIAAARSANVTSALLLSVAGADLPGAPSSLGAYRALEIELAQTWPSDHYIVLRTLFYQQNLELWAPDVRAHDTLRLPLSGRKLAPLYQSDVAAVTVHLASVATLPPRMRRRTLCLTGPRLLTGPQLAAAATSALGARISYEDVKRAEAEALLVATRALDASEATLLLDLLDWQSRAIESPSSDVQVKSTPMVVSDNTGLAHAFVLIRAPLLLLGLAVDVNQ